MMRKQNFNQRDHFLAVTTNHYQGQYAVVVVNSGYRTSLKLLIGK
ncbi:MAG: hypothetical protein U5L96_19445 [Owenweeksia sp.]|nr:hypothetical protein [Owenweeksia sp.]